jgi:phosphonatase-like hydrolase
MPLVDLVVFDIAGTTVRDADYVGLAVQSAFKDFDVELSITTINPIMGLPKPIAIQQLLEAEGLDLSVDDIHRSFVEKMLDFYRTSDEVMPISGVEKVFAELRSRGVKVALDTGFSHDITDAILDRLGWRTGVLDGWVSSDQVERGRPFPDMVLHHMRNFGIQDPLRVAKVGDAPVDLQEGTAAGCRFVVGVLSGTHNHEQLLPYPHTHIVDSIVDLPPLLLADPATA